MDRIGTARWSAESVKIAIRQGQVQAVTIIIQSPIRGPNAPACPKVYTILRGIVDLTLQMPMGYEEGTFEVKIIGKKNTTEYKVSTPLQGGLLLVQSRVDFSAFDPGAYQLTIAKIGESAKYTVPLNLE
jgi:hypothetical protein